MAACGMPVYLALRYLLMVDLKTSNSSVIYEPMSELQFDWVFRMGTVSSV